MRNPSHSVDDMMEHISVHMERLRCVKLVTDDEIAKRLGRDRTYVTHLRRGTWRKCQGLRWLRYYLGTLVGIAEVLGVEPSQLLEEPMDSDVVLARESRKAKYETRTKLNKARRKKETNQLMQERAALLEWVGL